jgi:diguanylate cyclase (GGDEF)-like protein
MLAPEEQQRLKAEKAAAEISGDADRTYSYRARRLNDGVERCFEARYRAEYGADGQIVRTQGVVMDVTERQLVEAKLEHLAHHDPLTDLPNRSLFRIRLNDALTRARRGEAFALCFVDLDRFKAVNDSLGHAIGDLLLQSVAERLRLEVRETDTVARLGGDEFAVIQVGGGQPQAAIALGERLVTRLSMPFVLDGHNVTIGASVGIAIAPYDGLDAELLLKDADRALYRAKDNGRGRVCRFEEESGETADRRRAAG